MNREAIEADCVDEVVAVDKISKVIMKLIQKEIDNE